MEVQCFQYFLDRTCLHINENFCSDFWDRYVLQLAHKAPAVKYGILALACMHRQWDRKELEPEGGDGYAHLQYQNAVAHTKALLAQHQADSMQDHQRIEIVLISCILFVCIEYARGGAVSAAMHLSNGLRILQTYLEHTDDETREVKEAIVELFLCLDTPGVKIRGIEAPKVMDVDPIAIRPLPCTFASPQDAKSHLNSHLRSLRRNGKALTCGAGTEVSIHRAPFKPLQTRLADTPADNFEETRRLKIALENLAEWKESLERSIMYGFINIMPNSKSARAVDILRIQQLLATVVVRASFLNGMMAWDSYEPEFREIIRLAKLVVASETWDQLFTMDLGILPAISTVCLVCRHPAIRRDAIALLGSIRRFEGLWKSMNMAEEAKKFMEIEESRARYLHRQRALANGVDEANATVELACAADIPSEARVTALVTGTDFEKEKIYMVGVRPSKTRGLIWVCSDQDLGQLFSNEA